ncbi:MAG TPA: LamG-like jellyroll fold domain-containing protein [Anaerolineae bacterium]
MAYVAGELGSAAASVVLAHLLTCTECAASVTRLRAIYTVLSSHNVQPPPPKTEARAKAIFARDRRKPKPSLVGPIEFRRFNWRFPLLSPVSALLMAALILLGSVGIVFAMAQNALPGDALYGLKTAVERIQVAISPSEADKVQLHLAFAQTRLQEVATLTARGRYSEIPTAMSDFQRQIDATTSGLKAVANEDAVRGAMLAHEVTGAMANYMNALAALRDSSPQQAKSSSETVALAPAAGKSSAAEQAPAETAVALALPTATSIPTARIELYPVSTGAPTQAATQVVVENAGSAAITSPMAPAPTDTPQPTPTLTPSSTPTSTPSATPTPTWTSTPSPTDSPTATDTPTPTHTPVPTDTPTDTPTPTATSTATDTPAPVNTATAIGTPAPTPEVTLASAPPPTGEPAAVTPGSLLFDGVDDRVRTVDLPLAREFTIELWVRRTADSGGVQTFLSDATDDHRQAMFSLYVDGGSDDCRGARDQFALSMEADEFVLCSRQSARIGVWYHVAVSRDRLGTVRFFVNGRLRSIRRNTASPVDSSGALTFGRAGDYDGEYFSGLLDEIRISNAVIYTSDFTPLQAPLTSTANTLALWHLDEGSGRVVLDSSGNGRQGTLQASDAADSNGPTWSTDSPVGDSGSIRPSHNGTASPTSTPIATAIDDSPTILPTETDIDLEPPTPIP